MNKPMMNDSCSIHRPGFLPEQQGLRFRNMATGKIADSIWNELLNHGIWRSARFEAHEANTLAGAGDRSDWAPVLEQWSPIARGQCWCEELKKEVDPSYIPIAGRPGSLEDFLAAAQRFFATFNGRKIGVQLSGGFDSSLIIGLLRHFRIDHGLVGLVSNRYEFRTERHIQEKLAAGSDGVILIDEATCLPCSRLDEVPPHQVPDLLSLDFAQDLNMALTCKQLGIEVLLSGGGGDNLFGQAVPDNPHECSWRPQTFTEPFPVDVVYRPNGIEFFSFYGDLGIVDTVYGLRKGAGEDYRKLWARHFFSEFIPHELVDYHYCADFWGRAIDGLIRELDGIRGIHRRALEITGNSYFKNTRLEALIAEDLYRPRKELYQRIEARISSAAWVCSLANAFERPTEVPHPR